MIGPRGTGVTDRVAVKANSASSIPSLTNLGLADTGIRIRLNTRYDDIIVDSWGEQIPVDVQWMLADAEISMTLVHFDRAVLDVCFDLSMGGPGAVGEVGRAGQRLGGGLARFAPNNFLIGLNLSSPVAVKPWRFFYTYLVGPATEFPLGTKRSIVSLNWRAIPYSVDPFGGGTGSLNSVLFDYSTDS